MAKCYAYKVINVAKKYVGYLEKESNNQLENMTANAGDENFTIFAKRFKEFSGINNQGCAWCDMFVDCDFVEAYSAAKAKILLGGFSGYTPTSAQYFKDRKQWYTNNPHPGDQVFFKNNIRICHTGLVYKVTKTMIYTIEGNTSNGPKVIPNGGSVCLKSYLLSNPRIAGYGRPKYDLYIPYKTIKKESPEEDVLYLQCQSNKAFKALNSSIWLDEDGSYGKQSIAGVLALWELWGWNKNGQADGTRVGLKTINKLSTY